MLSQIKITFEIQKHANQDWIKNASEYGKTISYLMVNVGIQIVKHTQVENGNKEGGLPEYYFNADSLHLCGGCYFL